jgi:uncharacterized protein YaeQ
MADKTSIFKVKIDISNIDQHRYEQLCFTMALNNRESLEHMILRLIAYAMVPEQKLVFGNDVCKGDTPDVMVKDYDDHFIYWIDIGEPSVSRVKKASHVADNVLIFSLDRSQWLNDCYPELRQLDNMQVLLFDPDWVAALEKDICRNINWSVVIDGDRIGISNSSNYLESSIIRLNSSKQTNQKVLS